jgi:GntR family transcriptional regulator
MAVVDNETSPMHFRLRGLIVTMMLDGKLNEGEQLPSVRAFAADHKINPLTVAKAYQHFQDHGYIIARRGVGMFIADGAIPRLREAERELVKSFVVPKLRHMMKILDITLAELITELERPQSDESPFETDCCEP